MVSKNVVTTRSAVWLSSSIAAAVALFSLAQGCSLLTKTDRDLIETGGNGGEGGTTSQGGAGGTTVTTGGGGSGGACTAECCSPSDCPQSENECEQRACTNGVCGTKPVAADVPVSTQTAGDCQEIQCDGKGATKSVADADDVLDDGKQCTVDTCENGAPKNKPTPAGQSCDEGGGIKCDGSGVCAECLGPGDCTSKVCTVRGVCAPPECADGVKNSDETDTDCGGVCGATCLTNDTCQDAGDCVSGVCSMTTKKCLAPTCSDLVKNADETDVDCGGVCGATCAPGDDCEVDEDCVGDACSGSFCLPSCTDGVKNNAETGLDCGGPVCTSTCVDGTVCNVPSDCTSGSCVDGFCCDTACTGTCMACSAALQDDGEDGVCGPATQGIDPHDDCDVELPGTCGNSSGMCDGAGACQKYPAGTSCGDALSCTNGVQTNPDWCDGAGECNDAETDDCGLYACLGDVCGTSCAGDAACAATAYCATGVCVAKKVDGAVCAAANQCASGACVDGVCCDTACTGPCVACSVTAGGPTDGVCSPVALGSDPAGDCGNGGSCDGAGVCKKPDGQVCAVATECLSGNCADGFCCITPCVGLCQACSAAKKGFGLDGACGQIAVTLDPDNECPGDTACSGGGNCTLKPTGATCAIGGECQTNFCVDGVCCGAPCLGFCQACSAAKTDAADGTCADITLDTDPDEECPGATNCAGGFACTM